MVRFANVLVAVALAAFCGCGNSKTSARDSGIDGPVVGSDSGCTTGALRCRCSPNNTCNDNLICMSQVCVEPAGSDGSPGSGGGMGSGGAVGLDGSIGSGGGPGTGGKGSGGSAGSGGSSGTGGAGGSQDGAAGPSDGMGPDGAIDGPISSGDGPGTGGNRPSCGNPDSLTFPTITVGYHHTCLLTTAGGVRCWGHNGYGQLGDGTPTNRSTPPTNDVLTGVQAVAAGDLHTCALMATDAGAMTPTANLALTVA